MMEQLRGAVTELIAQEYTRAAAAHGGAASSPHEGYALIKEELEESQEQLDRADQFLEHLWHGVRADELQFMPHYLQEIREAAILGACELIQTAAMAEKALAGLKLTETRNVSNRVSPQSGDFRLSRPEGGPRLDTSGGGSYGQ